MKNKFYKNMEKKVVKIQLEDNFKTEDIKISVDFENRELIVSLDRPKPTFKIGDVVNTIKYNTIYTILGFTEDNKVLVGYEITRNKTCLTGRWCWLEDIELVDDACTAQYKEDLMNAGWVWDEDQKEMVRYAWKPKVHEKYYIITICCIVSSNIWIGNTTDRSLYNVGNCFKTKELAQAACDKIKEVIKESKKY